MTGVQTCALPISALTIGDSLRVADIVLPVGVTTEVDPDETVAIGMITRSTLEAIAAEEAAEAEAEALELEGAIDGDSDEASADDTGDDTGDDADDA